MIDLIPFMLGIFTCFFCLAFGLPVDLAAIGPGVSLVLVL